MHQNITWYAITLDPEGERYRRFTANNAHLTNVQFFRGIRGAALAREERVSSGLLTAELEALGTVTDGTVGCAASHRAVWRMIASADRGAVIMEDDVITHPEIAGYLAANGKLLANAEAIFLSVNTDSVLSTVSTQGLHVQEIMSPQYPSEDWIRNALARTAINEVRWYRMLKGLGLCCYWLSPEGARKLLELCFPLTSDGTDLPFMKDPWPGSAIDGRMNAFFPSMRVYVTRPFLAYSPNTDSATSV